MRQPKSHAKNRTQRQVGLFDELIVDNFAGAGGASIGIEWATGRQVDIAVNHDKAAIRMHEANHPLTKHLCEDVFHVNPVEVCDGRPVGLAWFSPDCKHFSKAKGGKPVDKKIRGLAWVAIRWAATVKPRIIILENVEEFITWGPLDENGEPIKKEKGKFFKAFVNKLRKLGYQVEWKELIAYEFGVPTSRKRFFLIARCDGQAIVWPELTHGKPNSEGVKSGRLKPWRTAAEIIDWSIPCQSIFERKKPLAEATLRRIARGIQKFVIDAKEPFIVTCNHGGEGFRGQGIDEPFKTVTSSRDAHGVVVPTLIQTSYGERPGQEPRVPGLDKPLGTIVAQGVKHAVVEAELEPANHNQAWLNKKSREFAKKNGLQVAKLMHYRDLPGGEIRNPDLKAPLSTITAGGVMHALEVVSLMKNFGGNYEGAGIDVREPVHTVTSVDHHSLLAVSLDRQFGNSEGAAVDQPVPTITAGGDGKTAIVTSHIAEVRAFLDIYNGNNSQGQELSEPINTVTVVERFSVVTINSVDYVIVDIGMRMLKPHELAAAQGFPEGYLKPGFTQTEQVRMVGNSVCPGLAEAIVRANYAAPIQARKRA